MKSMYLYQENSLKAARRPVFGEQLEDIANGLTDEFVISGGELQPLDSEKDKGDNTNRKPTLTAAQEPVF